MAATKNEHSGSDLNSDLWFISKAMDGQFDLRGIEGAKHSEKIDVKTYQLSDIALLYAEPHAD